MSEIVLHDKPDSEVDETLDGLRNEYESASIHYFEGDVRSGEFCRNLVRDSIEIMGGLDILINNAGTTVLNPIENFSDWNDLIAINLSHSFFTTSESVKYWRKIESETPDEERVWGRIINISSVQGVVGSIHKAGYVSAKHGLMGLTKVTALELAETTDITANAICPCFVSTPLAWFQVEKLSEEKGISLEEAEYQLLSEKQPRPVFTLPEDVAAYCLFLCSDHAQNVTGSSVMIDGGWTAQ